jgi:hypothetical protein
MFLMDFHNTLYTYSWKNQSSLRRVVDQLFKSNLAFCVVCVFNLQFEKSVFLRRLVLLQSTLQRQFFKNTLYILKSLHKVWGERVKKIGRLQNLGSSGLKFGTSSVQIASKAPSDLQT